MNTQYRQKSNNITLVGFLVGAGAVLAVIAVLLVLEKLNVTHFYTKPASNTAANSTPAAAVPSATPTNTVNYAPPTPADGEVVVPSKNTTPSTVSPVNTDLSATINSTRKSNDGTLFLVKVAVAGTQSGTCSATMTKGGSTSTKTGTIALSGGQYICTGLDIPMDTLSAGTWSLKVTVTDANGASTTVSQEVDI
jgi:hypothetical protein